MLCHVQEHVDQGRSHLDLRRCVAGNEAVRDQVDLDASSCEG